MTPGETAAANTTAARALVAGLAACGVTDVCVTPGSRSTPLTVAFAEQSAVRPWLHIDERSAAFFGLGLARATGRAVALLCTSGTAAANYLPAITEANLSRVPLVVLTADRPPALQSAGAPQTMDQVRLYGSHVRCAIELPAPSGEPSDATRFRISAERAVRAAVGPLPGPVHVNVPFDEPLIAPPAEHPAPPAVTAGTFAPSRPMPSGHDVMAAAHALANARRPIIVAGPETGGLPAVEIAMLARVLGAPVVADALSGLRTGGDLGDHAVVAYDAYLRDATLAERLRPDAVVQFGAAPTSKPLNQLLGSLRGAPFVLCDLPGGFRDPNCVANVLVAGDPAFAAEALAAECKSEAAAEWLEAWRAADSAAAMAMRSTVCTFSEPFEGRVFIAVQDVAPAGTTVVAGNSMPVRDLDSFIALHPERLVFAANRGVNGIDGVVSSAMGAAAARSGPVVLVLGDLSFYHDMNGLWAAMRHGLDMTVVVVNNNGGGIFHYLPQAAHGSFFEEWFGTPAGIDFAHAAAMYGASFERVSGWPAFEAAIQRGFGGGFHVVELVTDRARNAAMHRDVWAAATAAARAALA